MPQTPAYISVETLRDLDGLDFLRGIMAGQYPVPPIATLLGFELSEVEDGRVVFSGIPTLAHYNPLGSVHGGYFATLLDSCMACAVQSKLKAGYGYTTLEFKINLVRAMTEKTGRIYAEGRSLHTGRQVATSEGILRDEAGRIYAHGTTTCLVFSV
ncbi:PaaI family thioesterase [Govanella unica]|uniref:PaaI family thioesterase n=1 Tax=Govanella unica TaxID=2975056 RepID=A0A9X3TZE7_9PROT|nr:PaaI family thioesterase [Govania unica]MDA5194593.1 PaaI family thioesterase [Govania unica]